MEFHSRELNLTVTEAGHALAAAAHAWGAEWKPEGPMGGQLHLPAVAGLRRGFLHGRVALTPLTKGCRVSWKLERAELEVHRPTVTLLTATAVVVIPVSAWPFYPPLLGLLPLAGAMAFLAWFLVLSRLQSSGPEEFFAALAEEASPPPPPA